MREILAVFRKDARHSRTLLATLLTLTTLTVPADSPQSPGFLAALVSTLWGACWMYVAAFIVQEENPIGDCQYWLTRPYDWRRLLTSKLLYAAAFAALPLMLARIITLAANGVGPVPYFPRVIAGSLLLAWTAGLVAAALAAVTRGPLQFLWAVVILAAFEATAVVVSVDYGNSWAAPLSVSLSAMAAVIAAAGIPVLMAQYRTRVALVSRIVIAVASLMAAVIPLGNAWASVQYGGSLVRHTEQNIIVVPDAGPRERMQAVDEPIHAGYGRQALYIPIEVRGIPSGAGLVSRRVFATVESGHGEKWRSGWTSPGGLAGGDVLSDAQFIRVNGAAWQYFAVDRSFYDRVKDSPVSIHLVIDAAVLRGEESAPLLRLGRTAPLPRDGICSLEQVSVSNVRGARGVRNIGAACAWPQPGPERAYIRIDSPALAASSRSLLKGGETGLFSLDPSVWSRGSTVLAVRAADAQFSVETWRQAAPVELRLDLSSVRLAQYAPHKNWEE